MRFKVMRQLIDRLRRGGSSSLELHSLTESEREFGQIILPLAETEDALARQTSVLQVAVDLIAVPVLILTTDHLPLMINAAARELLGSSVIPPDMLREARALASLSEPQDAVLENLRIGDREVTIRLVRVSVPGPPPSQTFITLYRVGDPLPTDVLPLVARQFNLTPREAEVVEKLIEGLTDKEIASDLAISVDTVRAHIKQVFRKAGVTNRTALVSRVFSAFIGAAANTHTSARTVSHQSS